MVTKLKAKSGVAVTAAPASADYLQPVEILVSGLDLAESYTLVISDGQGHSQSLKVVPDDDGTFPYTFITDSRGTHTVEVLPAAKPIASTTFRGV